jgi:hypothetical protein
LAACFRATVTPLSASFDEIRGMDNMSFAAMLFAMGANAMAAISVTPVHQGFLEMSSSVIAAESSMMTHHPVSSMHQVPTDDRPDHAITAPPDTPSSLDLAIYVGDRRSGPQLELGALGGGRADAPGLVHVGFGLDF